MIGISYMSRQVLRALSDNGPMLKSELNAAEVQATPVGLVRHPAVDERSPGLSEPIKERK